MSTRHLSDSAHELARATDREIRRLRRDFVRANRRANRAQWWIDNGATVAVVVVSFVAAGALVALQVWLP